MSLVQFLRILMARRWIILAALISCTVVALAVASQLPKRFPARARVMLDVVKPDPVTGQVIASTMMRSYTKTQTELVKDYRVAGEVVDKLGFTSNPSIIAEWQASTGGVGDMRRWAAQRIMDNTDASMLLGSNIMEISYTSTNPTVAKNVAAMLREAYIDATLRFRTDSAGRTAEWYRDQAEKARRQLVAAETAESDFEKANNIILGPTGIDPENQKLQALQQALINSRTGSSGGVGAQSTAAIDSLNAQLAGIDDQIAQAAERYGPAHPTYKALVGRRATLQSEISRNMAQLRSSSGGMSAASQANYGQLTAEYEAQKQKVMAMQDKFSKLSQLQREVAMRQAQYDKATQRTADLRLEADVAESGLVVLGDVIGSNTPSFPNIPLIGLLAAVFGLTLGIVIALFSELMARRVRGVEDLAFASKVPVLAVIAEGRRQRSGGWLRRLFGRVGPQGKADWQPAQ